MANSIVKIDNKLVGENQPAYLIAEIGINHNGDMQIVKRLIDSTFACGWDCVKFQKRVPEIAVPEKQKGMLRETPWGTMTYLEYKKKIELTKEQYDYIDAYCREKPIAWSCSPWDVPSLEFIMQYDIPFIKIASATITNHDLLREAVLSMKPIILSTGMSTLEEIDASVEVLEKYGKGDYILLHTNSAYPANDSELNLLRMNTLKQRYNCIVGYSGHEYDLNSTVVAAAMGAKVIERHITIDHSMWGTDQSSSLEVRGMDYLARRIHKIPEYLGEAEIAVTKSELPIREKLRKTEEG